MKTQRRHELQTNELMQWIAVHMARYQAHMRTIVILVVGGAAILLAVMVFRSASQSRDNAAWRVFYNAFADNSPEALLDVARQTGDSDVTLWAKQTAAERLMNEGVRNLFIDREEADRALKEAEKHLKEVEKQVAGKPALQERVRLDLAQTYESMNQLGEARKYYDLVAKDAPSSAIGKMASSRSETLARPDTEAWYDWFAQQKPKTQSSIGKSPGGMGGPSPLLPGSIDSLKDLPDAPDLPSLEKQFSPGNPAGKTKEPSEFQKTDKGEAEKDAAAPEKDAAKPNPPEDDAKKDDAKNDDAKNDDAKKDESKVDDSKKDDSKKDDSKEDDSKEGDAPDAPTKKPE